MNNDKQQTKGNGKGKIVLPFLLIMPLVLIFLARSHQGTFTKLGYYGTPTVTNGDTIPFKYEFPKVTTIEGKPFNFDSLKGFNFILTSFQPDCPNQCGINTKLIEELIYSEIYTSPKHFGDIKIVSIVSDNSGMPLDLSPDDNYYISQRKNDTIWSFVEGNPFEWYNFTAHDTLFTDFTGKFIGYPKLYANSLVFVDKYGHVRAVYEGKTEVGVRNFMDFVRLWYKEEDLKQE